MQPCRDQAFLNFEQLIVKLQERSGLVRQASGYAAYWAPLATSFQFRLLVGKGRDV
jgi:hypothetical protein